MHEASVPEFKADLRRLISYYTTQIKKLNIKVVYEEATFDVIKDSGFDVVIVAVGGITKKPNVPGIDKPIVTDPLAVLNGKVRLGQKVLIVGGGVIAVEVGLFLAEQGKDIIFSTRQKELTMGDTTSDQMFYGERLSQHNVTIYAGRRLEAINDKGAILVDKDGHQQCIEADNIVLNSGYKAQTALIERLEQETDLEIHGAGDCLEPRRIFDAIHEGFQAAWQI